MDALRDSVVDITPVGSLRRFDASVGDISLLAVTPSGPALLDRLATLRGIKVLQRSGASGLLESDREQITLYTAPPETAGAALLHYTGSRTHVVELGQRARARNLEMTPAGVSAANTGEALDSRTEELVYKWLDLPLIPPELREGQGEIEAATAAALPSLVQRRDIRGDLHMHSNWSDGRDSITEMVRQAAALGYEYVAITDHSQSSSGASGLTAERLRSQRRDIDDARRAFPNIEILHGAEVDILPDGALDFPDSVLVDLDIVLASLHDSAGQRGTRLTERYLRVMRHPLVNIITHPTNRMIGYRDAYDLDFPKLFEVAVETGTVLEIDGAPGHLDMDGALARQAVDRGVTVSINSDCHRAAWLDRQMTFGVGTARRGWIEARQVLNTRPVSELREMVERKRRR